MGRAPSWSPRAACSTTSAPSTTAASGGALRRAERYRLLALDDLGAERPTEWAIETLTRLIDTRVAEGLPTIVTSNYRIGQIRDLWGGMAGKRVASRLAGACRPIEVKGQDRRLG